jgi:hypothetical protein
LWSVRIQRPGQFVLPPWPHPAPLDWNPEVLIVARSFGVTERMWSADVTRDRSGRLVWSCEYGWPLPSLGIEAYDPGVFGNTMQTDAIDAPRWLRPKGPQWLPTAVLPLGFALNTLFYASVLLGLVECVAFARRRVRRGRGRCASCGYDRAGLAEGSACPECGGKA